MTQTEQPAPAESTFDQLSDNRLVRNLVFVGAAAVAVITAGFSIWQEFYTEMVKREPFKKLREDRDMAKGNAHAVGQSAEAIQHDMKEADKVYTTAVTSALKKEGVSSHIWSGTWSRLKQLGTFDKLSIAMKTGASLGVTLGTYYLINQNVRMKANNKHQDDKLSELRQRIDAQGDRQLEAYERAGR